MVWWGHNFQATHFLISYTMTEAGCAMCTLSTRPSCCRHSGAAAAAGPPPHLSPHHKSQQAMHDSLYASTYQVSFPITPLSASSLPSFPIPIPARIVPANGPHGRTERRRLSVQRRTRAVWQDYIVASPPPPPPSPPPPPPPSNHHHQLSKTPPVDTQPHPLTFSSGVAFDR